MILMKNLILILIFAAVGLNTMASNPVHVIITAGQSNTDGRTPNEDLPAYIKALATDTLTYTEGAYRSCHNLNIPYHASRQIYNARYS